MSSSPFTPLSLSLADCCGEAYVDAVCEARSFLAGTPVEAARDIGWSKVDFLPEAYQARIAALCSYVGQPVVSPGPPNSAAGAATIKFNAATKTEMAPLSGFGPFRIGENGRLYLATKSEHYHASLGHGFPGYRLLEHARQLGIPNATHNNTRGHITRLAERALVAAANGLEPADTPAMERVLSARDMHVMNRVLNLETGSLALEAALKMILARFYRVQPDMGEPPHAGKRPVILVVGDEAGNLAGNYHGTTVLTQIMRGMWPEMAARLSDCGAFAVHAVRPNNVEDVEEAFRRYNTDTTHIAGFFHEIVMMNYGGLVLTRAFLQRAYALCAEYDVPTVCDEIQSCIWSKDIFMFREYGLKPTFVSVGKGFPGGEYPASRIIFSSVMDCDLPQFGALVTNGQEELASLAYLVTLSWAKANATVTAGIGARYAARLREVAASYGDIVTDVAGHAHMSTLFIKDLPTAKALAAWLVDAGLDISAQTYKVDCPPALLTKLPLIADDAMVDCVVDRIADGLAALAEKPVATA